MKMPDFSHKLRARRPLPIGARFTALLLLMVAVLMASYGWWFERRQAGLLMDELQRDADVMAATLSSLIGFVATVETQVVAELVAPTADSGRFRVVVYNQLGSVTYPVGGTGLAKRAELESILAADRRTGTVSALDPSAGYVVLTKIESFNGVTLGALELQASTDQAKASIRTLRQRFLIATLGLFLATALTTLLMVRRVVTRPLRRLRRGVAAVAGGNLEHRIQTSGLPREVLDVSEDFNQMADALTAARLKEREDAEERLMLEREILRSKQLAAVGQLSSGLAHQIATPLNVIAGRTELVLQRATQESDKENLGIVLRQIARITQTVAKLLNVARRAPPAMTEEYLSELIDEALTFLQSELQAAKIEVDVKVPKDIVISVDRPQWLDVFEIVLLNATHAMKNSPTRQLNINGRVVGSDVVVEIQDTGQGIAPEHLGRIFDPFFSTRDEGTGLGLMIAKHIVEAHGGSIAAENRADPPGALIRISVPVSVPAVAHR